MPKRVAVPKGTAIEGVRDFLDQIMNQITPKLHSELQASYRKAADARFNRIMQAAQEHPEYQKRFRGRIGYGDEQRQFQGWRTYTHISKEDKERMLGYDWKEIEWKHLVEYPELFSVSYREADADAKRAVDSARDSFVWKNTAKFAKILGDRKDLRDIKGTVKWTRGVFAGNLEVHLSNAKIFSKVSLKYVVRTVPRVTPYYQYPLLFTRAIVKGKTYKAPSETELQKLLGQKVLSPKEELTKEGWCPGSGGSSVPGTAKFRYVGSTGQCPSCKERVSITSTGTIRKHKTEAAREAEAAKKLEEKGYCAMSRQPVPQEIIAQIGPVDGYKDPKAPCPRCGQKVRLDSDREWIRDQFLTPDGYPTKMLVTRATYYKHKLKK